MGPNMYLYEKAREAHYQDLQREMAESRLLVHLPRHRLSWSRHVVGKPGVLLLKLDARRSSSSNHIPCSRSTYEPNRRGSESGDW